MAEEAKQGELGLKIEPVGPIDKVNKSTNVPPVVLSVESAEVRPAIDILAHKDEIIDVYVGMFSDKAEKDQVKRNQAYREKAIVGIVEPIYGVLYDKENGEDLRRANVNRTNALLTGMGAGITKQDFKFTNSAALGDNSFRQAQFGELNGSTVVGDHSLEGDFIKGKKDNRGIAIPEGGIRFSNSTGFGGGIFADAINGLIKDSVIGVPDGDIPRAYNVDVENTYFVTEDEITYVKKGKFTGKGLKLLPAIRTPLKEWQESRKQVEYAATS